MSSLSLADLKPIALDLMLVYSALIILGMDVLIPAGRKRVLGDLTFVLLAGIFALSFFMDTSGTAFFGAYHGGEWPLFFTRIFLGAGALAVLGSIHYVDTHFPTRQGEFYLLLLCSLLGMTLLPGARNLLLLIVCFELMGMPLAMLAAYGKNDDAGGPNRYAAEAGLKLYIVGAASTAITLFGLSLVYGMAGTVQLNGIAAAEATPLLTLGMFMTLAGMSFKIGAVPFHMWIPDTYQGAATPFVAFLSTAPKAAGFSALALLFMRAFAAHHATWMPVLLVLTVGSLVIGNLMAIPQSDVKRLLAYSGVAHIGYMLMALATGTVYGTAVLLFYLAGYAVTNIGAFLVVQAVAGNEPDATKGTFDGLAQRSPGLALALLLFLLSLAGIPFVVGFWAKLYVFLAVYRAGLGWLVLLGALLAVVALWYYLQVAFAAYMRAPRTKEPVKTTASLRMAIALCLIGVLLMGVWPGPFLHGALSAARAFFG